MPLRVMQLVYNLITLSLEEDPMHTSYEMVLTQLIDKQTQSQGNSVISTHHASESVFEGKLWC